MNKRIRELAEQAGFHPEDNWDHTNWHAAGHNPLFEKFAELIVRECIAVGMAKSKELFSYSKKEGDIFEYESHGAEDAVDSIKQHFGVE